MTNDGVDNPTEKKDIKKHCNCMTWLRILWNELHLLFVRRRTRGAHLVDTSPVYDGNSLLDDQSLHEHNLLSEYNSILPSDPNCGSYPQCCSDPLVSCSPLSDDSFRVVHGDVKYLNDYLLLDGPQCHIDPLLYSSRHCCSDPLLSCSPLSDDSFRVVHGGVKYFEDYLLLDGPQCHVDPLLYYSPLNKPFHLGNHNFDKDSRHNLLLLPDDIIIDILSRLTFGCAVVCWRVAKSLRVLMSCHTYNHTLLTRRTPIVVIQCTSLWCKTYDEENKLHNYRAVLHFVYENGNKILPAKTKFRLSYVPEYSSKPSLTGSYSGFLVFKHARERACIIFNPVTQEKVIVTSKGGPNEACGLYFHAETSEYRILYIQDMYRGPFRFGVLSLRSQLLREVSSCTVAPCMCRSPVILNKALHWMASLTNCSCCSYRPPICSDAILVFNMDKENFITLPHPGDRCQSMDRHSTMQLLEMDGCLCLFDISLFTKEVSLWVLQNYTEQVWVKQYVIDIKPRRYEFFPKTYDHSIPYLRAVMFQNEELLLMRRWNCILYYHLKQRSFREVEKACFEHEDIDSIVAHTNTFSSLHCDSVISF